MTGLHRSRKKKHRGHYFGWYELIGRNQCHLKIAGGEGTRGPFNHFLISLFFLGTIWFLFSLAGLDLASNYYDQ